MNNTPHAELLNIIQDLRYPKNSPYYAKIQQEAFDDIAKRLEVVHHILCKECRNKILRNE